MLGEDYTLEVTTRISRDRQGNVTSVDDGRGKAEVSYNKPGFPVSVKDPIGNATRICYNTFNAPESVADANGIVAKYAYNDAGLVTRMERLDGSETLTSLAVFYDAAGCMVHEGNKTYRYGYLDKVLSVTDVDTKRTFSYHADGQLASASCDGIGRPGAHASSDIASQCSLRSGDMRTPQTETFLWDGLALIQRGDEQFVNEPHVGGGNPVASSKGISYFNDMLGTTVGSTV